VIDGYDMGKCNPAHCNRDVAGWWATHQRKRQKATAATHLADRRSQIQDTNRGPICLVKNAHVWTYALSGGEHNSEQILEFALGAGSLRQNESRSSGIDAPFFVNAQFCSVLQETFR
jgi:hypothetical protein